jgi:hypothetical protein
MRANGGDYLVINYTSEDGCHIEGAEIPRSAFHISPPNDQSEGSPPSRHENKQERNGDSLH